MHVDRIVPPYRPHGSGYEVGAAIRIAYQDDSPARGPRCGSGWTCPTAPTFQVNRPTGGTGIAAVSGPAPGTYTFTVVGMSQARSVYNPSENNEITDSVTIP